MSDTEARHLDPEIARTLDALVNRHPAFLAHERFVRVRLAELAQRSYQHGAAAARLDLRTADDVAGELDMAPRTVRALANKHGIGWNTGRDWVFTRDDLERLRTLRRSGPGRPRRDETTDG